MFVFLHLPIKFEDQYCFGELIGLSITASWCCGSQKKQMFFQKRSQIEIWPDISKFFNEPKLPEILSSSDSHSEGQLSTPHRRSVLEQKLTRRHTSNQLRTCQSAFQGRRAILYFVCAWAWYCTTTSWLYSCMRRDRAIFATSKYSYLKLRVTLHAMLNIRCGVFVVANPERAAI